MKLLREPLLHFVLIGAAIYLLYGVFAEPVVEETDKTIVVSAGGDSSQSNKSLVNSESLVARQEQAR